MADSPVQVASSVLDSSAVDYRHSPSPPSPSRALPLPGLPEPTLHLGSFSHMQSQVQPMSMSPRRSSPPREPPSLSSVPELSRPPLMFSAEDLLNNPGDSRYPAPAQPPMQPVMAAIEEVCVECMMRDRDMADVDVTSRGIWARESDVWYEELVRREEEETRSGMLPDPQRRRTPARGTPLTEANLRIWTQMHPKEPQARWITLTDFVRKQAALLEAEHHARAQAARESRMLDSRLRDTYHQLRRSAYDLNDGPVRIRAPTNPEPDSSFLAVQDPTRDITVLASGMIQERVDLRKEEKERRRESKRHRRMTSRQSKGSTTNIDATSVYSSPSPPPDGGSRMGVMGRSQPALTTPVSPGRRLSTPLTPPLGTPGARPSIHTRSSQSSFESRAGKKGFLSFKHWSGFGSETSFGPAGAHGAYRGSVYDSVADMHLVLDQEKQGTRMPYDQMSLAPSYATGADGTIHADQPEKKKKHKGLTKIWKIVTGSATKDKHAPVHEKHQLDDEPLAPPPPLSYLVSRQGGERGGAGGARDLDRRASTPTSSSRSAAAMSPATAPSSILPSPTSQRFPWRDSGSDEDRGPREKREGSYLEVPSPMSMSTVSPNGRRSFSTGATTSPNRPASFYNTNKSLPPLPSEAFSRGNGRSPMDARPQTLAVYGPRRSELNINAAFSQEPLAAPRAPFGVETRRQSFGGTTARPDLDGPLVPPPRIGTRYDEFGASRRSLGSLDNRDRYTMNGKAESTKRGSMGRRLASFLTGGHKKREDWEPHFGRNGEHHPSYPGPGQFAHRETPTAGYARSMTASGKRLDSVPMDDFVAIRYPSAECQSLDMLRR
ncbi:hypothetical protein RSOLAG22IIIB_00350 [Rhizoctonia solani]|uniref:Uncharacterized protein n=1 Tax=Rhizoctonia solani TaxID=456999 RepID=A0A0K6FKY3_9AGAM|nr:hypothetical protein RSOLAG22IIIB_00350 [Rhizoctonia solani]